MEKLRVLLVDDEQMSLLKMLKDFENTDFEVEAVERAEKAIDLVGQKDFDIIFTDLILPGKNGAELCAAIKKIKPKTEVVLISGRPEEIEKYQTVFLNAGGRDELLRKPLIDKEILETAIKIRKEIKDKSV